MRHCDVWHVPEAVSRCGPNQLCMQIQPYVMKGVGLDQKPYIIEGMTCRRVLYLVNNKYFKMGLNGIYTASAQYSSTCMFLKHLWSQPCVMRHRYIWHMPETAMYVNTAKCNEGGMGLKQK